jgi:hypothetical protein
MSGRDWRERREAARAQAAEVKRLIDTGSRGGGRRPRGLAAAGDGERHPALVDAVEALTEKLGAQHEQHGDAVRRLSRRVTVILGAVLLLLAASLGGDWIAWRAMNETHLDARNAFGEARRANRMSRAALIAVGRAFVLPAGVRMVASRPMAGDLRLTYVVSIDWENAGATPTRNLTTSLHTTILPAPVRHGAAAALSEAKSGAFQDILGPHQKKRIGYIKIPASTLVRLQRGHKAVYLVGRADYQDVLSGGWHVSEQCVELTPFIGDPTRLDGGFIHHARPCPTLNCADGECRK